jgi:hypothetical protein
MPQQRRARPSADRAFSGISRHLPEHHLGAAARHAIIDKVAQPRSTPSSIRELSPDVATQYAEEGDKKRCKQHRQETVTHDDSDINT